jgi:hypothetical protein
MSYLPPYTFVNSIKKFDTRAFSAKELDSLVGYLLLPEMTKSQTEKLKQFCWTANLPDMQNILNKVHEKVEKHAEDIFKNQINSTGRTDKEQFARNLYGNFIKCLISARSNAGKQQIILAAEEIDKIVVLSKYNHHLLLDYRPTTGWIECKKLEIRQIELEQKQIEIEQKVKQLFSSSNSEKQAEIRKQFPHLNL